jgi:hypothetical protein
VTTGEVEHVSKAALARQQNRAELEAIKADGERVRAEQAQVVLRLAEFVRSGKWKKLTSSKDGYVCSYLTVAQFFDKEFPGDGLAGYVIAAAERKELVSALKYQNLANTRIAALLGVSEGTVRLDLGTKQNNTGYVPRSSLPAKPETRINPNQEPEPVAPVMTTATKPAPAKPPTKPQSPPAGPAPQHTAPKSPAPQAQPGPAVDGNAAELDTIAALRAELADEKGMRIEAVTAALDIKKDYLKAAEQRDALKAENAELKKKLTAKGFDALEAQLGKARERIVELESQLAKALP